jgi:hypothetical protein
LTPHAQHFWRRHEHELVEFPSIALFVETLRNRARKHCQLMVCGAAFAVDIMMLTHAAEAPPRTIRFKIEVAFAACLILYTSDDFERSARPEQIIEGCLAFIGDNDSYVHGDSSLCGARG